MHLCKSGLNHKFGLKINCIKLELVPKTKAYVARTPQIENVTDVRIAVG